MVLTNRDGDTTEILLTPNLSAGWPESKRLVMLLAIPVSLIAVGWWFAGAVLILPFAGLELALLTMCLRHVCRQGCHRQLIRVSPKCITMESGIRSPEQCLTLQRPATHLHVVRPGKPVDMIDLLLVDERQRLPIGPFLNKEDREAAREALRSAGLMETSNRWWETRT